MWIGFKMIPEHQRSDRLVQCAFCGRMFVIGAVLANAYSDSEMDVGPVCSTCLEAGPEEVAEQLKCQAALLRWEADEVEAASAEDITVPGIEYLRQLEEIAAL